MALPEKIQGKFKLVNYKHTAFNWRGKGYSLETLTIAQADELYASGWPYIKKVVKKKAQNFPADFN